MPLKRHDLWDLCHLSRDRLYRKEPLNLSGSLLFLELLVVCILNTSNTEKMASSKKCTGYGDGSMIEMMDQSPEERRQHDEDARHALVADLKAAHAAREAEKNTVGLSLLTILKERVLGPSGRSGKN